MEEEIILNIIGIIIAIAGIVMARVHPRRWKEYIFGLVGSGAALNVIGIFLQL